MRALEVPLAHTLDFIAPILRPGARILEVGAGEGDLAERLAWRGFHVTAIDLEHEGTTSKVSWVKGDFLTASFGAQRFDAVLFTRSLHHIAPIGAALDRARDLLAPGGSLIAEEFSVEAPDRETARWYYELIDLLGAAGLMHAHAHEGETDSDSLERWRMDHDDDPPLNTGAHMMAEIGDRFRGVEILTCPYLYRTFAQETDRAEVAQYIFAAEKRRIERAEIRPVGLRIRAAAAAASRDR